jgi:hypothetical protein
LKESKILEGNHFSLAGSRDFPQPARDILLISYSIMWMNDTDISIACIITKVPLS